MDAKAEAKAIADAERHAKEFRKKHDISDTDWEQALEILSLWQRDLLMLFWAQWKKEHDKEADNA